MRRKIRILISRLVVAFVFMMGATGCTFSHSNKQAKTEATMTQAGEKKEVRQARSIEKEKTITSVSETLEKKVEDVPEGVYCLRFFPDEICFDNNFVDGVNSLDGMYYIPDEGVQKKIQELLEHPKKKEKETKKWRKEYINYESQWLKKHNQTIEASFSLLYKKGKENIIRYNVNVDGIIENEDTIMNNPKLYRYLSRVLKKKFQYEPISVTTIKNIESATLEYVNPEDKKQYRQTIKNKDVLEKFESWFSHAKACYSGDRPYFNGLLTLKLKNGRNIKLTMASTGVPYFSLNGDLYNYEPDPNSAEAFNAYAVFEYFNKIPYYNYSD